ncbi:MAG: OmpH family outer membrane protein [Bacteroidales bacterium]|nr:OmpH family outer membrane protein [Bacteroidales bacterium]
MKKLPVILFSILFLAVAALFVLQFTGKHNGSKDKSASESESTARGIAFVNIDTIVFNFKMFEDRRADLIEKQQKAEAELNTRGNQYERGVRDFQEKVSKGLVTRSAAAEMEQALIQQQQDLVNLRDKLQADLVEEDQVMNRQILEYITKFLEENKAEYNYEYIFGKSFGSVLLYGSSANDITKKVLDALNAKYQAEKK